MKLAIAQMVLGVLILAEIVTANIVPGLWGFGWFWIFTLTLPPLGLTVLGCGIAQYLKAEEAKIKHGITDRTISSNIGRLRDILYHHL